MDNSYFILTDKDQKIQIEKFHICTWDFNGDSSLIEFGCEINQACLDNKQAIRIDFYIPWFTNGCAVTDFYTKLSDSNNSRFIFNDSINNISSLDGGRNIKGLVYEFSTRNKLCILPISVQPSYADNKISIEIDLSKYKLYVVAHNEKPNIYIRFAITPYIISTYTVKNGISKSMILYDIKVNEKRNFPLTLINQIDAYEYCEIETCFCFNIIPNRYELVFLDDSSLQSVRTLEYESFKSYLDSNKIKEDELIVVFNKKHKNKPLSFFNIYSKERIGIWQFVIALFMNFVCGIFLFIPSFRKSFKPELPLSQVWKNLPLEIYLGLLIILFTLFIFIRFYIFSSLKKAKNWLILKVTKD